MKPNNTITGHELAKLNKDVFKSKCSRLERKTGRSRYMDILRKLYGKDKKDMVNLKTGKWV